jgi:hypothetical protein
MKKANNTLYPDDYPDLAIQFDAIVRGGRWVNQAGQNCGEGLFEHFIRARALIWPDRYRHEWTDLLYHSFIENDICIMMGAASTQKTSHAAEYVLLRYWMAPKNTLVVVSTIDMDKLDTGVFGEIKMLWEKGRDRWPWLSGHLLEHRRFISSDSIEEGDVRDFRRGCIGRPCYVGGRWVGLGKLAGTKQENIIFLADELQFMAETFIHSWPNLFSNGNVKIIGSGNPKHDPDDQLGIAAEPKEGWASVGEPKVTTTWATRFMGGICVNLVGTDSPNFRAVEKGLREPYPKKLIGPGFAERIAHDWGTDSPEYYTQVKGVMRIDMAVKRVITRMLCREHGALGKVVWSGKPTTKVMGVDPSYGGGDACIEVILEWGEDVSGEEIIRVASWKQIKLDISKDKSVEDQIADVVFDDLEREKIPYHNAFYDPYGKGTIGYAFSRRFPQGRSPIPVDSGGRPTSRPVRSGLFVDETDSFGQVTKRLKRCDEHYSKFVSESWFSVRYVIEAGQMRELPEDMMLEGCGRKYDTVAGNKIEVEPKDDMKERGLKSPNKFDALAVAMEGARQRGFKIGKLSNAVVTDKDDIDFFSEEANRWKKTIQSKLLKYA